MKHDKLSPYSASITGCAYQFYEFRRVLPLLMSPDADQLARDEVRDNRLLQVNSESSRKRFMAEFRRRYQAVEPAFWRDFLAMEEPAQRAALLYVLLKTYRLVFDFHFNVAVRRWNGVDQSVAFSDIMMELGDLSTRDAFVGSWTEATKKKCASQYLTILRQCGMLDERSGALRQLRLPREAYDYYVRLGEEWFLDACLLYPYEIANIKTSPL